MRKCFVALVSPVRVRSINGECLVSSFFFFGFESTRQTINGGIYIYSFAPAFICQARWPFILKGAASTAAVAALGIKKLLGKNGPYYVNSARLG